MCTMCGVCWSECRGWSRSCTRSEVALALLQTCLLLLLVALLVFLVLHLTQCSTRTTFEEHLQNHTDTPQIHDSNANAIIHYGGSDKLKIDPIEDEPSADHHAATPDLACSWTPSAKTDALAHYYESDATTDVLPPVLSSRPDEIYDPVSEDFAPSDHSDGEEAGSRTEFVLALVKLRPPQDVTFGCILTAVSEHWALTAASCIEAIEEVDSLDSFVIMEEYGTPTGGRVRQVSDLQVHPSYRARGADASADASADGSYDLAALRADAGVRDEAGFRPVTLASVLDVALINIGEQLHILGFGAYRSIDKSSLGRALRRAHVYRLPGWQCEGGAGAGALRHLEAGGRAPVSGCGGVGPRSVCAGVLHARGLPCNYCSGTPLVLEAVPGRGEVVVGLMSENVQCGVSCEPQLFVNLALLRDWIDAVCALAI